MKSESEEEEEKDVKDEVIQTKKPRARKRTGDKDKLYLFCNHTRLENNNMQCGVHYKRHLKDKPRQIQHSCLGSIKKKSTLTRTLNKPCKSCNLCDRTVPCIGDPAPDEIKAYLVSTATNTKQQRPASNKTFLSRPVGDAQISSKSDDFSDSGEPIITEKKERVKKRRNYNQIRRGN